MNAGRATPLADPLVAASRRRLGIGLGVVLLIHLTLHWDWVIRTTRKLLRRGVRDRFVRLVTCSCCP